MKLKTENVKLMMWTRQEMPEAKRGADGKLEKDAQGKIVNTGNMIEYTEYYFRDMVGEGLKIMKKGIEYRDFEGSEGDLVLKVDRREFQGKAETKVSLLDFVPYGAKK